MRRPASRTLLAALLACVCAAACSPGRMGVRRMAAALSDTASAYSTDNDPEFVRLAAPSTLKMVEMLLDQEPRHEGLLMTACSGFTQYAYAFLDLEAEASEDAARAADLRGRARAMYSRARGYCWRALDIRHEGLHAAVSRDPDRAAGQLTGADVPAIYWLSAAWGGDLASSGNQLARLTELVAVRVLLGRAIAIDDGWEQGALHEAFIALDGMSPLLGGSAPRARRHFDRAVALSGGQSASAYVTLASTVSVAARDREEFERLLRAALAVDVDAKPAWRLANLVAQRRARALLAQADRLFPSRR